MQLKIAAFVGETAEGGQLASCKQREVSKEIFSPMLSLVWRCECILADTRLQY